MSNILLDHRSVPNPWERLTSYAACTVAIVLCFVSVLSSPIMIDKAHMPDVLSAANMQGSVTDARDSYTQPARYGRSEHQSVRQGWSDEKSASYGRPKYRTVRQPRLDEQSASYEQTKQSVVANSTYARETPASLQSVNDVQLVESHESVESRPAFSQTPEALESANGYHPVGEVNVPNKRTGDHVVRIVKAQSVDKYVCWTAGTRLKTTLKLPGATTLNAEGSAVTGESDSIPIILEQQPSVVLGTPYINTDHSIAAKNAGLVGDGITDNTMRLNTILRLLPTDVTMTISWPKGHFAFNGVVRMASNVTMLGSTTASKNTPNSSLSTFIQQVPHGTGGFVIWYPTGRAQGYDGMHDVAWKNMYFQGAYVNRTPIQPIYQPIIHARNISFDNCTFAMVQRHMGHLLDVDGSTGVSVRNSTVIGSADQGQTFKEAFQMDVAALGASGYYDKDTVFNNLPTTHMTIEHNRFLPLRGADGAVLVPAAAPFGTHMAYAKTIQNSSYIRFGIFRGNYVEDPVSYEGAGTENSAVIHFDAADDITIDNNVFVWTGETPQSAWSIAFYARSHRMVKPRGWHNITITNNVFKGFAPKEGAFALYQDPNSIDGSGKSVSHVNVSCNRFEGTPIRVALRWMMQYSKTFIATYDQRITGSNNVVNDVIHLDGGLHHHQADGLTRK